MLGFVTQERFDAEQKARLEAEKDLVVARELAVRLGERLAQKSLTAEEFKEMYRDSVKSREIESAMHAEQMANLLRHIAPLQHEQPSSPETADRPAATYEEIMAEPASTKREMYAREMRANRAREEQRTKAERDAIAIRRATLTVEELEANQPDGVYDDVLGVNLPAEDSETHVN